MLIGLSVITTTAGAALAHQFWIHELGGHPNGINQSKNFAAVEFDCDRGGADGRSIIAKGA
jgi:hypothetical protein